jgi:hypothetical protein
MMTFLLMGIVVDDFGFGVMDFVFVGLIAVDVGA